MLTVVMLRVRYARTCERRIELDDTWPWGCPGPHFAILSRLETGEPRFGPECTVEIVVCTHRTDANTLSCDPGPLGISSSSSSSTSTETSPSSTFFQSTRPSSGSRRFGKENAAFRNDDFGGLEGGTGLFVPDRLPLLNTPLRGLLKLAAFFRGLLSNVTAALILIGLEGVVARAPKEEGMTILESAVDDVVVVEIELAPSVRSGVVDATLRGRRGVNGVVRPRADPGRSAVSAVICNAMRMVAEWTGRRGN